MSFMLSLWSQHKAYKAFNRLAFQKPNNRTEQRDIHIEQREQREQRTTGHPY